MSQPGILFLAAGASRRYRAVTGRHKLSEPVPGSNETLFGCSLKIALATGAPVHALLGAETARFMPMLRQQGVSYTLLASQGLGESVASGVKATPAWSGWIVMLADMPFVSVATVRQVMAALQLAPVARPVYHGLPGHPVGFRAECRDALQNLCGDEGAKALLRRWSPRCITTSDKGSVQDIDRPDAWPRTPGQN